MFVCNCVCIHILYHSNYISICVYQACIDASACKH